MHLLHNALDGEENPSNREGSVDHNYKIVQRKSNLPAELIEGPAWLSMPVNTSRMTLYMHWQNPFPQHKCFQVNIDFWDSKVSRDHQEQAITHVNIFTVTQLIYKTM